MIGILLILNLKKQLCNIIYIIFRSAISMYSSLTKLENLASHLKNKLSLTDCTFILTKKLINTSILSESYCFNLKAEAKVALVLYLTGVS